MLYIQVENYRKIVGNYNIDLMLLLDSGSHLIDSGNY